MKEYHKIDNIFVRDIVTNKLRLWEYKSPEVEYLAHNDWIITEKIDGTNVRVMWDGASITFAGRTEKAEFHPDLVKRLEEMFLDKISLFIEKFGDKPVCFYGEGYGAGIQKGGVYKKTKDFILFDVMVGNTWLERGNVVGIADVFGIECVPIVCGGSLLNAINLVANGLKSHFGDFIAEGVICKPKVELTNRFGDRVIVKIKTRDFTADVLSQ